MRKNSLKRKKTKKIKIVYRKLGRENVLGFAYQDENLIEIDPRLKPKMKFAVIIHECLHLAFPKASESQILKAERLVINMLWSENYRKVEN